MSLDLDRHDTICALATGREDAALAIFRVSGRDAEKVLDAVFRPYAQGPVAPFVARVGRLVDADGAVLDEVVCTYFAAGRSYTGEPSFELSVHGGHAVKRAAQARLVEAGCRLAEPGEFTLRAVLTGRLDLAQAEAVEDVIKAKTQTASQAALQSLAGGLGDAVQRIRDDIVDVLAELEARLDFPDEPLGEAEQDRLAQTLDRALAESTALLGTARFGLKLTEGARVLLYGVPNAGKSTLLNGLCGEEKALVHDVPGTTRDVLEGLADIGGVACTVVDVAGVRRGPDLDPVEKMGIARAEAEWRRADVVVCLCPPGVDRAAAAELVLDDERPVLFVRSKADLDPGAAGFDLSVSAATGAGLAELRARVASFWGEQGDSADEVLLTRARHHAEMEACRAALGEARAALAQSMPGEVVAGELRRAGAAIDRLVGQDLDEDVLDVIFSRFCIGK